MNSYRTSGGKLLTSKIASAQEVSRRMENLDWLRVITEAYETGEGKTICEKAVRAYNKLDNFTGIIRLTSAEKEFLEYILNENEMLMEIEKEVLEHYIGIKHQMEKLSVKF